jgi:hypothetical protein
MTADELIDRADMALMTVKMSSPVARP